MGHGCHDCGSPNSCECVGEAMHCEHANEVPTGKCECSRNCYCRHKGTCRDVFDYKNPDGSIRRELRLPESVFKPEALTDPIVEDESAALTFLLEQAKNIPPPTERHRQAQALSFAYGNLALSTNHQPSYEAFEKLAADRYGWTKDEFAIFAATRKWK